MARSNVLRSRDLGWPRLDKINAAEHKNCTAQVALDVKKMYRASRQTRCQESNWPRPRCAGPELQHPRAVMVCVSGTVVAACPPTFPAVSTPLGGRDSAQALGL